MLSEFRAAAQNIAGGLREARSNILHGDGAEHRMLDADDGLAGLELRVLEHLGHAIDAPRRYPITFQERFQRGRVERFRDLPAPVYGWFTERFDIADLKDAKALLEELA